MATAQKKLAQTASKRGSRPSLNNGLYQKQHARIDRTGRQMEQVRELGYQGLDSAINNLYANMRSTQKGVRKHLTADNARDLTRILRAAGSARASNRRVSNALTKTLDAYQDDNGMLTQVLGNMKGDVRSAAREAGEMGKAGSSYAENLGNTTNQVVRTLQASGREAHGAARTMAAEALSRRTTEDLSLIAQQHHEVAMAQLQAKIQMAQLEKQMQMERKQFKWEQRQAEKTLGTQTLNNVLQPQVQTMTAVAPVILERMRAGDSPAEIKTYLLEQGLVNPGEENSPAISSIIRTLSTDTQAGVDAEDMAQEIFLSIKQQPEWAALTPKQEKTLKGFIEKSVRQDYTQRELSAIAEASSPADPSGSPFPGSLTDDKGISGAVKNYLEGVGNAWTDDEGISGLWS